MTIGIIPGYDDRAANPWVEHVICTGLGQARNALVAATGQALIAVGGGWGTLSEIALGLRLGRPVVLLGGWANLLAAEEVRARLGDLEGAIVIAETPEAAVDAAIAALSPSQPLDECCDRENVSFRGKRNIVGFSGTRSWVLTRFFAVLRMRFSARCA